MKNIKEPVKKKVWKIPHLGLKKLKKHGQKWLEMHFKHNLFFLFFYFLKV